MEEKKIKRHKGGSMYQGLKLATSNDGLNFKDLNRFFTEHGSVSSMITLDDTVIIAYQYFDPIGEFIILPDDTMIKAHTHGMAISKSTDGGKSWSQPKKIRLKGFKEKVVGNPCDPAIVLLEDKKIRLYFTCGLENRRACTLSAISDDHEIFEVEEGIRFIDENRMVLDATVIKIGNLWHYFAPIQGEPDKSYHATSRDGLKFKYESNIVGLRLPGNACKTNEGYRFYTTFNGISSAFSKDGYNWIPDPGVRLMGPDGAGDASVTRLKDGTYLMVYNTRALRDDPFD